MALALAAAVSACGGEQANDAAAAPDDDVTAAGDPNGFGTAINMGTNAAEPANVTDTGNSSEVRVGNDISTPGGSY